MAGTVPPPAELSDYDRRVLFDELRTIVNRTLAIIEVIEDDLGIEREDNDA